MTGKSFRDNLALLGASEHRLFQEHSKRYDGRRVLIEGVIDEAMLRLAFGDDFEVEEQ